MGELDKLELQESRDHPAWFLPLSAQDASHPLTSPVPGLRWTSHPSKRCPAA